MASRPTEYNFKLTVPIGNDELWEEIERLPSAQKRRARLKKEILATLGHEGWFDVKMKDG